MPTLADVPMVSEAVSVAGVLGGGGFTDEPIDVDTDRPTPLWKRVAEWESERAERRRVALKFKPCDDTRVRIARHFGDYKLQNMHLYAPSNQVKADEWEALMQVWAGVDPYL